MRIAGTKVKLFCFLLKSWIADIPICILVFRINKHACGAMIESLIHLAFVERHPLATRTAETVAADGLGPFLLLQLLPRSEETRVIGHVEHSNCNAPARL